MLRALDSNDRATAGVVSWPDEIDDILAGDLTCGLVYSTPAGGAVVTAVSPIGLRDRATGTIGFTTSLGMGRKLDRIAREPKVALAYHSRAHGLGDPANRRYVLVQGTARFDPEPDRGVLDEIGAKSAPFMGERRRGVFWDRWLSAYYDDRVLVQVTVTRIVCWPDLHAAESPVVYGAPLPVHHVPPQVRPAKGIVPRGDVTKSANQIARLPYRLLGYRDDDGYPMVLPVQVIGSSDAGIRLFTPRGLPPGGRRAGLLAHSYHPKLVGVEVGQYTGWLESDGTEAGYAPHTRSVIKTPASDTVMMLVFGFLARHRLKARRRRQA
ncbi:hypothetical protein F5X71_07360 [Nocardia brasiliensis]|uniref:Pyridoxamine 5'-phosphate oxidase family protein n=1 Tax=Nocardia brasiliensis TaxID=37326 RepID=A0A6G9XMN2_NOCBR|nr:hypothetical protein [Nocardia brasiliensis]QIS02158.1 hypothetical protein F5X71_07360 [Nocardia brasiliensis]